MKVDRLKTELTSKDRPIARLSSLYYKGEA